MNLLPFELWKELIIGATVLFITQLAQKLDADNLLHYTQNNSLR